RRVPVRSRRNHLLEVIESLNVNTPADKTDLSGIFEAAAGIYPNRGMMIVISDLLADPEQTLRGLKILRQRGHDVLVLHVMDDDEIDFPFSGPTRFDDLEIDRHLNCNPQALRDGYLSELEQFLKTIRRGTASAVIDYALIRTSDPMDAAMAEFMSRRLALQNKKRGG
ncbi:MAG: DUF58 domain-containing protein, partial [Planctomycetota bacterium]